MFIVVCKTIITSKQNVNIRKKIYLSSFFIKTAVAKVRCASLPSITEDNPRKQVKALGKQQGLLFYNVPLFTVYITRNTQLLNKSTH